MSFRIFLIGLIGVAAICAVVSAAELMVLQSGFLQIPPAGALIALRAVFAGWPLHPLGYALCGFWTMILLWFPCLLVWVAKGALLRYGRNRMFQRMRPLFLGFIPGEFGMVVVWTLAAALAGIPTPQFTWP